MSVLEEMTALLIMVPGPGASDDEIAAWYERKAHMFEHIAADGGAEAEDARRQAVLAHRHAVRLLSGVAA